MWIWIDVEEGESGMIRRMGTMIRLNIFYEKMSKYV